MTFFIRCEVFRAMLCVPPGDDPSSSLYLSDIKPGTFLAVLEFVYTNCCSLSTHMVDCHFARVPVIFLF